VGNGSNELTYTLGQVFVAPGAPVVLPRPMFSLYEKVVRLAGGEVVGIAPREDLHFDIDAIVAAVEERDPALTVLTTPNNPTGLAIPLPEIERVVRAAKGFVVVDEAYVEFTRERSAAELLGRYPNVLIMRTLSKAFGLAGLRLGYMMGHPDVIEEVMKARLPFMVDAVAESVGVALLENEALRAEHVAQMAEETQRLTEALEASGAFEVVPSQANFVLFRPRGPEALPSADVLAGLIERGVLIRDMSGYPELPGYLRVCAGTDAETQAFLSALSEIAAA
jgi:histidinol-phosphate aminotransferase